MNEAFYGIIMHDSLTLAIMVSLNTSFFMSQIKERKGTLPAIPSRSMAGGRWPVLTFLQP